MPIPLLESDGHLPSGVHDGTLDEIRQRFGTFQGSDQRPRLWNRFADFAAEVKASKLVLEILVDGSFVTGKPSPNDIDLIIVVPAKHDFSQDLNVSEYAVLSKRRVLRKYGFDILVAVVDSEPYHRYVRFFQQIRFEPGRTKGIVRVRL